MKKIRLLAQLLEFLDGDLAWRIKEISDIKVALLNVEAEERRTLLRAGIPMLYAHWEGFIKKSSESLLSFISFRGLPYSSLKPCYIVFGAKEHVSAMSSSGNVVKSIAAVEFFTTRLGDLASLKSSNSINTEANLSSVVFEKIALSLGIDVSPYETKFNLIDSSLLERRNRIAHGEYLDIDFKGYEDVSMEVIGLIRRYKMDIERIAIDKLYIS